MGLGRAGVSRMEPNDDLKNSTEDGLMDDSLKRHPLSAAWPDLKGEESQAMTESMRAHGFDQSQPVVLHEGMVLDGWHRYKKARELGIEPTFTKYVGDDPAGFVIGRHKARRHISKEEIATAVLRCREWRPPEGGRPRKPDHDGPVSEPQGAPRTNQELAEEAGVSITTVKRAKQSVRKKPAGKASGNRRKSSNEATSTGRKARPNTRDETDRSRLENKAPENGTATAQGTSNGHAAPENPNAHPGRLRDVGARLASLRGEVEEALTDAAEAAGDAQAWDRLREELDVDEWLRFFDRYGIKITWERRQPLK